MRLLLAALLLLGAVLVQVTWAPRLEVAGAFPNLALVAVVGITWTSGVRTGLAWACLAGALLDLTSEGPIGPHALALLAAAYVTGFWARNLRGGPLYPAMAAATGTALYSLVLIGADDTLGLPLPPLTVAIQLVVSAAVYNAVLMPVGLAMVRRLKSLGVARVEPA